MKKIFSEIITFLLFFSYVHLIRGNINPFALPGGYNIIWTGVKVLKHLGKIELARVVAL